MRFLLEKTNNKQQLSFFGGYKHIFIAQNLNLIKYDVNTPITLNLIK